MSEYVPLDVYLTNNIKGVGVVINADLFRRLDEGNEFSVLFEAIEKKIIETINEKGEGYE